MAREIIGHPLRSMRGVAFCACHSLAYDAVAWCCVVWRGLAWRWRSAACRAVACRRVPQLGIRCSGLVSYGVVMAFRSLPCQGLSSRASAWHTMQWLVVVWLGLLWRWHPAACRGMACCRVPQLGIRCSGLLTCGLVWFVMAMAFCSLSCHGLPSCASAWHTMQWLVVVWRGLVWLVLTWHSTASYRGVACRRRWQIQMLWAGGNFYCSFCGGGFISFACIYKLIYYVMNHTHPSYNSIQNV